MEAQKDMFRITPEVRAEIIRIVDERIREAHVTKEDFSELKNIVKELGIKVGELAEAQKELAEAQRRTEQRVEELAQAQKKTEQRVEELAQAQKKTEQRVEELAQAQKKTEQRVEQLAEETKKLAIGLNMTREELGGLERSFGYAFENEAYRMLPKLLLEKHRIKIKERFVRTEIGGKEINFFAKAEKDGKEVYIIGEAKLRLGDRKKRVDPFQQLEKKIEAVKGEYGEIDVVPLLVTHFARPKFVKIAQQKGIILVQSYEWE